MTDNPIPGQPSRRSFLKTAAGASATLAAADLLAPYVHAASDDTIKVGVIGCGGRGSGAINDVLRSAKGVKIVAVADVFENRAKSGRQRFTNDVKHEEVKTLGNTADISEDRCFWGLDAYKKLINCPEVNYVILATPPGFRPLHIEETVHAGKNLFTEKPVGVDGPGIRQVLAAYDASMKKGLHIGAGTQRRHQAGYIETMKRIHDGEIGDIVLLRGYWNGNGIWFNGRKNYAGQGFHEKETDLAYQLYNWYHFCWLCGDHIVEQHVHNLDVCNWAMNGPPIRAWGMGSRIGGHAGRPNGDPNEVGNIFDNFSIEFEYKNGARMISQCRHLPGCWDSVSEAIHGTKGFSQINAYRVNNKSVGVKNEVNPYVQEHTDLIASIRDGKPLNELKNVAESTMTAIFGRMAAYSGQALTWDQALNSKTVLRDVSDLKWDSAVPVSPTPIPGKFKVV